MHITDSDFASITLDGTLCDARGQLGPDEFVEVCVRSARAHACVQAGVPDRVRA